MKVEYRVVWKNAAGKEESMTKDQDYHPLTEEQARDEVDFQKRHYDFYRHTDVRVQMREITDWHDA